MDFNLLADVLFPDIKETPEDIVKRFPERDLPAGACVTRIGPSPTGFVHLGNLYNAIIAERLAHQSDGVFYLRIEDTDNKREVEGAVETLINAMNYFGVNFDEGASGDGENGAYAPYRQRQRKNIYQVFAKELVRQGKAYPCFLTAEELDEIREQQTTNKENPGIYGKYAEKSRNLTIEQIKENISQNMPWVLRYMGVETDEYITVNDAVRGKLEMPRNNMDFVLLKSDGIPTYHFAHVIDDHFMYSTHVIRGEEWLSSLPMHVELFGVLGWEQPIYCHTATLMKMDGGSKRKLSKRKDPELALSYYQQEGISQDAVWEFLLTLLNSNFEEWRIANPDADYKDFSYTLEKMSISGALVDLDKLRDISKNVICRMTAEQVYSKWLEWCENYNTDFAELIKKYPERTLSALNVGKGGNKPRKDIETWKQACDFMNFWYDETFTLQDEMKNESDDETRKVFFKKYLESYNHADESSEWFAKVKALTEELGFAVKPKDYKKNPDNYKGSIVNITNMLRIALTGRANAPDIWEISHVLGEEIVRKRLEKWI
ncbi:MAG: glutamate--tRNA ligase [Prevotella sp.]|nr:glutamate--tRNA ligase [Alistipes senegalensis]MCM1358120.1 glutamate--tRNA ligase [Prevotella sp.]MCM1472916.1 glutamate--tRNA ligase [Muribaculaceae bacterium]